MALKDAYSRRIAAAIIGAGLGISGAAYACPAQSQAVRASISPRSAYYLNYHAYAWAGDYSTPVLQYYPRCGSAPCDEAHSERTPHHGLHVAELLDLGRPSHGDEARGQACSGCPATGTGAHAVR